MRIGGVLLGAGMVLNLQPGDYLYGDQPVRFILSTLVEARYDWDTDWVVLQGTEKAPLGGPWRARRLQVRVSALARALALSATA